MASGLLLVMALGACATPPPTATGPAERFVARLQDPALDLVTGLEGSYTLAANEVYPIRGALAIDGPNARLTTAMEGPLGIDAWEQIVREGTVTERPGSASWQEPVALAEATDILRISLATVTSAEVVGREVIDGQNLYHVRASGLPIGPDAFGIEATGEPSATLDAWVDDEGVPARMRLETGSLVLETDGLHVGEAAPVQAPYEIEVLESSALRYALVVPTTWDVRERGTSGHFIGLDGAYVITYCAAGSMELPDWVAEGTALYSDLWGAEPESVEPITIRAAGGQTPATLSTWHGTSEGQPAYILDLAIVADKVACDIQWFSPPGDEAADRARFEQLLAGFRLGD